MAVITITTATDVGQGWSLLHPDGDVTSSDRAEPMCVVRGVPDGTYTLSWTTVPGYDPPSPASFEATVVGAHGFTSPVYVVATPSGTILTAIWANDGSDKVIQDELRAQAGSVINHSWDGTTIKIKAAHNEVAAFSLYLESSTIDATNVAVSFSQLDEQGAGTDEIASATRSASQLFEWAGSNIELFFVRYLQIRGLSYVSYGDSYDERHVPNKMRRPFTLGGGRAPADVGTSWIDRPHRDKYYPDILVPMEAQPDGVFDVAAGTVQQVWCDIYVPKGIAAGVYEGNVSIIENGGAETLVPVELTVLGFELPDVPTAKMFVQMSEYSINMRHHGSNWPLGNAAAQVTRDNYVKVLHRHRLSVIGDERGDDVGHDFKTLPAWWQKRLDGTLFSTAENYDGPGKDTGNRIFSIGTYAAWRYWWSSDGDTGKPTAIELQAELNNWDSIFTTYDTTWAATQPVERFCYLADEPTTPLAAWDLTSLASATPAIDGFTVDGATKAASRIFRVHQNALGWYTDTKGEALQGALEPSRILLQRDDDPENQWAMYELSVDATEETAGVALLTCTHIESAGDASFDVRATTTSGASWYMTSFFKDVVTYFDTNRWGLWAQSTPIKTFATVPWDKAFQGWGVPQVTHPSHSTLLLEAVAVEAGRDLLNTPANGRLSTCYNGQRPLSGSFATEDDGQALVMLPWMQRKLEVDWWFYWDVTLFNNWESGHDTPLFTQAHTYGRNVGFSPPLNPNVGEGETGYPGGRYSNGDGVLLYPGTDIKWYPANSYGIDGPIASIRLKLLRRGIQDMEYATLAAAANQSATDAIILTRIPSAMWELGNADPNDPGYQYTDVTWEIVGGDPAVRVTPDDWQDSRDALAALIP